MYGQAAVALGALGGGLLTDLASRHSLWSTDCEWHLQNRQSGQDGMYGTGHCVQVFSSAWAPNHSTGKP